MLLITVANRCYISVSKHCILSWVPFPKRQPGLFRLLMSLRSCYVSSWMSLIMWGEKEQISLTSFIFFILFDSKIKGNISHYYVHLFLFGDKWIVFDVAGLEDCIRVLQSQREVRRVHSEKQINIMHTDQWKLSIQGFFFFTRFW